MVRYKRRSDTIANNDPAQLWDLSPVATIVSVAKPSAPITVLDWIRQFSNECRGKSLRSPTSVKPAPDFVFFRTKQPAPITTLSPVVRQIQSPHSRRLKHCWPSSVAVASITALGAIFCAGCGVEPKICAMRA
ncbi:hypothetical protein KCP70_17175 [Salmonella enterica subsp. enterica]|nr:hypothetical protein KCP70_17175 [Salmonella enterica subsp. enterica]